MAKLIIGVNDLATMHPQLVNEWHPTKNGDLKPTDVAARSNKKVWWKCKHSHEWEAVISNRSKGRGCPYCSNKKVLAGFNDLATKNPKLASEWHPTKNGKLKPTDIVIHSDKKIWWKCDKGHEWQASIYARSRGMGCPYCSNHRILVDFNDLTTTNPELAKQWHPTKNGDLKPTNVTFGSSKKVWWRCEKGHEWQATVANRSNGQNCPYCSGNKVLVGFNDLATTHPKLIEEWHPTKNGDLKPTNVTFGSSKKVWWRCEKGHEWRATVDGRSSGTGCPYCSSSGTSLPEMTILYYFKKHSNIEIKHRYRGFKFELDLFFELNGQKIGIEYDGHYHEGKEAEDLNKNKQCVKNNIKLYRIRELPLTKLNDTSIDFTYNHYKKQELADIISQLIKEIFNKSVEIHINEDSAEINTLIGTLEKENSLATINPELAKEWHPTKNGILKPIHVTCNSNKKVWWMCNKGHEWQSTISHRVNGRGCPYCSNKKVLAGFNDLATKNLQLALEWHSTKNGDLKPTDVTVHSSKKVWWICNKGHEWQTTVTSRSNGANCHFCSGHRVLTGFNDLATTHPELAKQWHSTKNGDLKPTGVSFGSNKKVWWECKHGHEWRVTVNSRSNKDSNCPYCSNRMVSKGFNDLATTHPELAKEWHPTKNSDLKPFDVTAGSCKKIWWKCNKGHEWQATISHRVNGRGCPHCYKEKQQNKSQHPKIKISTSNKLQIA